MKLTPHDLRLLGAPESVLSAADAGQCVVVRLDGPTALTYEVLTEGWPADDGPCVGVCGVPPVEFRPLDDAVTGAEWPRLSQQCQRILDLLRARPAGVTNTELAAVALKYTGRISEVRRAVLPYGWVVRVVQRDRTTGLTVYRLLPHPVACQP